MVKPYFGHKGTKATRSIAFVRCSSRLPLIAFVLFAIHAFGTIANAQPFVRQIEPFTIQANGIPIAQPFAGGVNSPQHQFADIDGDNDLDLFVFDVDQNLDFYRNEGTRAVANFKLRNNLFTVPKFLIWFVLVDYDGDGRIDLCTEDSIFTGLRVYRNVGTAQSPQFSMFIPTLKDTTSADVYAGGGSIPTFVDIDADGDLDLFSANTTGFVNFYKNVGTRTQPRYAFTTGTWGNILILGDTCTTSASTRMNAQHGAAAYRFADIDGDLDFDFFVGDLFWTELFAVRNNGTPQDPVMECWTSHFPSTNSPVSTGFNQTSFVDIDNDGDLDLFIGVLAGIVQRDGFMFYRNLGSPQSHNLQRQTKNFLSVLDVGMRAHPTFVDIDNDNDQDLFIGNLNGELSYYRNTGSTTSPSFSLVDSVFVKVANNFYFSPAFVDIDNDGDKDLFAGLFSGRIQYFRNNGTPQLPQFARFAFPTDTIDVINTAAVAFADVDGDLDNDLFVGNKNGTVAFHRNTGSVSNFIPTLITRTFLNISLGQDTYIVPTLADYDGDGDFDFFYGTQDGRFALYENIGTPTNAQFVFRTNQFGGTAPMQETISAFVDIDADGDQDLFVGERKGGVHFYKNNRLGTSVDEVGLPQQTQLFNNYPNPFNPSTTIAFKVHISETVSLEVFDVLGKEVATLVQTSLQPGSYNAVWDATMFPSGVYFYTLTTSTATFTKKMILMK